ncbi:MAG: hypothetical protein ACPL0A_02175, partial [Candidatus Micrarchaeia archaeon]
EKDRVMLELLFKNRLTEINNSLADAESLLYSNPEMAYELSGEARNMFIELKKELDDTFFLVFVLLAAAIFLIALVILLSSGIYFMFRRK